MTHQTETDARRQRYATPLYAIMRQNGWDGERTEQVVHEMDLVLDAVLTVADAELAERRAANLHEAADAIEAEQHRLDDEENERLGGLSESAAAEHVAIHRAAGTLRRMAAEAVPAAVSAAVAPPTAPTHGLSVPHADALWDAVAIPGPHTPTYPEQHERVCRAVRDILDELTPARDDAVARTALRDRIADKLTAAAYECDGKCGLSERECYDAHPITFSAMAGGTTHVDGSVTAIADAVLAVLPSAADWDDLVREADRLRRDGKALHARAEEIDTQLAALRQQVAEPADRAAVLADVERAIRAATRSCGYKAEDGCDFCNGVAAALDQVRRMADETATETPAATTVPCSGTLGTPHHPHNWEPQPGMDPVHCPGTRKPPMDPVHILGIEADDEPAAGARQDGAET